MVHIIRHRHHEVLTSNQPYLMKRAVENSIREQVGAQQATTISTRLPTSTIILIVVFVIIGLLVIIGIAVCITRSRQQKKARKERLASVPVSNKRIRQDTTDVQPNFETTSVSDDDAVELEMPRKAILVASFDGGSSRHPSVDGKSLDLDTMDQTVGWVPQIKSQYGASVLVPQPSLKKQMQPKSQPLRTHHTVPSLSGSETLAMSPPPSYSVANSLGGVLGGVVEVDVGRRTHGVADVKKKPVPLNLATTPAQSTSVQVLPPIQSANSARFNLDVPAVTTVPSPLPSPARSASFAIRNLEGPPPQEHSASMQKITGKSSPASVKRTSPTGEQAQLPKLMTVVNTYTPNLEDELPIRTGDTVRMLEEFRDGWCVVQHVGEYNAAKGVVPRICLRERKSVVPKHRPSSSLASTVSLVPFAFE